MILATRNKYTVSISVYHNPTHTDQYTINVDSNHPDHVKRAVMKTLCSRAVEICSNASLLREEVKTSVATLVKMVMVCGKIASGPHVVRLVRTGEIHKAMSLLRMS